jgi:flagellum-specific peptidoglycan hydrolase FlgJ
MKKNFLIGGLIFVILLSAIKLGTKDITRMNLYSAFLEKYGKAKAQQFDIIYNTLKKLNLSPILIKYIIAQVMHETGVLASTQSLTKYNNYSGITYSGSASQKATGATKAPSVQPENKKVSYAAYPAPINWAKDLVRILSFAPNYPIKATSVADYAKRLKANGYYTAPESVYANSLKNYYDFLTLKARI